MNKKQWIVVLAVVAILIYFRPHRGIGHRILHAMGIGVYKTISVSKIGPLPETFPRSLRSFSGPAKAFGTDGKSWDAGGIGGPSNIIFVKGNYWMCIHGYSAVGARPNAIGCWFGSDLTSLQPYAGNPILVNTNPPAWAASCMEGPDLNTDGANVYISYLGFSTDCDDEDHGQIGISATTVANFPSGFSALPDTPQIPKPKDLRWLYRPFIIEINGICYDYSNAGGYEHQPVVASFKTSGPCATTEMKQGEFKFNRFELEISQPWEGKDEVEEPQVFRTADGNYVMLYGGAWKFKAGYAFTSDPVHGVWTKADTNPIKQDGILWLPRIVQDAKGQYWMFGNFNGTTQMNLWKANGD